MLEFDHIALAAPDIAAAVEFYTRQFGHVEVVYQDATWAAIRVGDLKIAFVLEEQHPPHLAFRTESREELEQRASEAGQPIMLHRDGSESFYEDDPGGNVVEVIFYPNLSV